MAGEADTDLLQNSNMELHAGPVGLISLCAPSRAIHRFLQGPRVPLLYSRVPELFLTVEGGPWSETASRGTPTRPPASHMWPASE